MSDVVIVGGGIAGSALAILLGRQGLEVELYERSSFPREKPCGEGLMPAGVAVLERLGAPASGAPFEGVRYHFGAMACAVGRFPVVEGLPTSGLGIRRKHLDAALFRRACRCPGVRGVCGLGVEGPLVEGGRVTGVIAGGVARRARLVAAADGLHSTIRNRLGLTMASQHERFGVRAHFRLAAGRPVADWVDVYLGAGHEVYVTPLPEGELLVAMLAGSEWYGKPTRIAFREAIGSHPDLAARLEGAEQISELAGASPLEGSTRARILPGLVLLGDAAGFVDPITGGGMTQALLSAELLAQHLERQFPPDLEALRRYDRERERMLRDYRLLTRGLLGLTRRPWLAACAMRCLRAKPGLFSHLVGVSAGMTRLLPLTGWPHMGTRWARPREA
jgi:flavin-dependent dehydrogenase